MSNFRLVLRAGPTPGKAFPLDKDEMFIGREATNEIVINDPEVSRKHARLFVQGGNMILEDLGSTNGTSVNGQRLTGPYVLRPGEIITLGEKITLLFESVAVDDNATMVGSSHIPSQPQYPPPAAQPPQVYQAPHPQQPAYAPPPPPRYQAPPPPPAYSGQIPVSPQQAPPPKKNTTVWVIVVVVILLFFICACAAVIYYIDANSLWCSLPVPRSIFQGCP